MQDEIKSYLQEIKNLIDEEIEKHLLCDNPLTEGLFKSAAYSTSGGKMVRAVFLFLIGENLFNVSKNRLLIPACSIELIHAASLIMDDLPYMDNSQLRRGKPANHVVFGQDVALLASVGILGRSSQIITNTNTLTDIEKAEIISVLTKAYGFDGLAAGQFVDLKLKQKNIDFKIIQFINQKKTAALFSAAGEIAALLGSATKKEKESLLNYAENIGFAFQIIDDMLDIVGDEKIVGKNLDHDNMNFVKLVGLEKAKNYLTEYNRKAEKALIAFGERANLLKAFGRFLLERAF